MKEWFVTVACFLKNLNIQLSKWEEKKEIFTEYHIVIKE